MVQIQPEQFGHAVLLHGDPIQASISSRMQKGEGLTARMAK